jgi:hypothetical protein
MCDGRTGPASQGYEARDAADFAAAGVDMLKVDSCGGGEAVDKYGKYVDTEEPLVEQGRRQCAYRCCVVWSLWSHPVSWYYFITGSATVIPHLILH